jgi:hypothetical protein
MTAKWQCRRRHLLEGNWIILDLQTFRLVESASTATPSLTGLALPPASLLPAMAPFAPPTVNSRHLPATTSITHLPPW